MKFSKMEAGDNMCNAFLADYRRLVEENLMLRNKLEEPKQNSIEVPIYNKNALLQACENGDLNVVKAIAKDNISAFNNGNNEALLLAVKNNYLEIVKYLIKHGSSIHGGIAGNCDVLLIACELGYSDMVQYLIPMFKKIEANMNLALAKAAENGHLDIIKLIINEACITGNRCAYAMRMAAKNEHLDIIKFLIEKGNVLNDIYPH